MKVIFLDVDGVLNHNGCAEWNNLSGGFYVLDAECVNRIQNICRRTGARVVLSSTWRASPDGMAVLLRSGIGEFIIGVTPYRNGGGRHKEIEDWLLQHSAIPMQFVVVDDDADAEIPLLPFVRTSFEAGGLTPDLADKVEAALA